MPSARAEFVNVFAIHLSGRSKGGLTIFRSGRRLADRTAAMVPVYWALYSKSSVNFPSPGSTHPTPISHKQRITKTEPCALHLSGTC